MTTRIASTEGQLLLALISECTDASPASGLDRLLQGTVDWTVLVQLALDHGVGGVLCHNLCRLGHPAVPEEILSAAAIFLERTRKENGQAFATLSQLMTELEERDIPALPFKGPVLAQMLYGDLGLRNFRDLDFLVHPEHVDEVLQFLVDKGYRESIPALSPAQLAHYRRYSGQAIFFGPSLPIEPHWEFAARTLAIDIDYPSLWERSREIDLQGWRVRALAPEDLLILLCLHGGKESWTKIKWVADLAVFLEESTVISWRDVYRRTSQHGILRMTLLGLSVANKLLGAPLPQEVRVWIDRDRAVDDLAVLVGKRMFDPDFVPRSIYRLSRFHWRSRERFRGRVKYVVFTLITPRITHFESLRLPDSLFFLYYGFKPLHDYLLLPAWIFWKWLRRLSWRSLEKSLKG